MITIENKGRIIYLFGRLDNREKYTKVIDDFYPYFYVSDVNGEFQTIDKQRVRRITVLSPFEVNRERERYPIGQTYEDNIRYVNRFIIDRIEKIEKEPIRKCYIDIEIGRFEEKYGTVEEVINPILSIVCYDNFSNVYTVFCIKYNCKNEEELLVKFIDYIKNTDPDMLIAWNGDEFDFPYLINRIIKLKLNVNNLSRNNLGVDNKENSFGIYHIRGRVLFDLMHGYRKLTSEEGREKWGLDYISKYELREGGGKEENDKDLDNLYKENIEKFVKYNKRDVELLFLLDEKLKIVDFFDEIRRLCLCRFSDIFMNSKIADCLCLKYAKNNNIILPGRRNNIKKKYLGGFVIENTPKLYQNIAVMDMKSLYASIMIAFNTSYETILDKKEEDCINIEDNFFFSKKLGVIPSIVQLLLNKREKEKEKMKKVEEEYGRDSEEYKVSNMIQYSLKVIANSIYGVMGFSNFRLFNSNVASSITYTARMILKELKRFIEKEGYSVIYGDTDSVFIDMKSSDLNYMTILNKEINDYFGVWFKKFNVPDEKNIFYLEFEKVYKQIFFKRREREKGVKKKYAGRIVWKKGKVVDEMEIKGFESQRSDTPQIGRDILRKVLKAIVYSERKEEIDKYVNEERNKILMGSIPAEELGLPIGISKDLEEYGNQIQIRASRIANKIHGANIHRGDKIKYIFVKTSEKVIAFKKSMWKGYEIDYIKMVNRIIDMKIGPIYQSLDWVYPFYYQQQKKEKELQMEDLVKQTSLWGVKNNCEEVNE